MPPRFEWDEAKNAENIRKHGVSFNTAILAFSDKHRVIARDKHHSIPSEERFFCFGIVDSRILTVRFTIRRKKIRIFGAGYWRQGKLKYEKETSI